MHRRVTFAMLAGMLAGCAAAPLERDVPAGFDPDALLTIEAPVAEVTYRPPELVVVLAAQEQSWRCLLGPPAVLAGQGLTEAQLAPGTPVVVAGHPSLTDAHLLEVTVITVAGQTFELR
ncbi:hypothetical protein [Geminicoccus flavidas]|uniref:hypothetical protein n=1 Tax=Geminicoccus flavidas TaxID=2506407 RepID=UPI0013574C74|nr:hypothetical protein [Geminicoccus flavidas]